MCGGGFNLPLWGIPIIIVIAGGEAVVKGVRSGSNSLARKTEQASANLSQKIKHSRLPSTRITSQLANACPADSHLYVQRALCFLQEGNVVGAEADLRLYISGGGKRIDAKVLLAIIYDILFRFDESLKYYNEALDMMLHPQESQQLSHEFHITTFLKPTYCLHCSSILHGLMNQGLSCKLCSAVVHKDCANKFKVSCTGRVQSEHNFVERDFHYIRTCAQCNSVLKGLTKQGCQCLTCEAIVHKKCQASFTQACTKTSISNRECITFADIYGGRGLVQYHNSLYEKSIDDLTKAIELSVKDVQRARVFHANRGLAHFYLDKYNECIVDLSFAIENGFEEVQVYTVRASAYQLLGRDEEAAKDRQCAFRLDNSVVQKVFPYPITTDIACNIFSFLSSFELYNCMLASKQWKNFVLEYRRVELGRTML